MYDIITHPERKSAESFLRNTDKALFDRIPFATKRRGKCAYDGNGRRLPHVDWRPVFVQTVELTKRQLTEKEAVVQINSLDVQ